MVYEPELVRFADHAADRFAIRDARGNGEVRRAGGLVERVFLLAPDRFSFELEPNLRAARAAVLAVDPGLLDWHGTEQELEREIMLAKITLERRVSVRGRVAPRLHWFTPSLFICVPFPIPSADHAVAVRVWLPLTRQSAFARAVRVRPEMHPLDEALQDWLDSADSAGADPTIWRCELPSCCEVDSEIVLEVAPNPCGFLHAMHVAHRGAATIIAGWPSGVGRTSVLPSDLIPPACVLPSGWSYLKPDRTQGSCAPSFPNGACRPSDGVFVPDDALFRACAWATWPVSLEDAARLAREDFIHQQGGSHVLERE